MNLSGIEVLTPVDGASNGGRWAGSALGARLEVGSDEATGPGRRLVRRRDRTTGLVAESVITRHGDADLVETSLALALDAPDPLPLWGATSAVVALPSGPLQALVAASSWSSENRWSATEVGPGRPLRLVSTGSWSSGTWVPCGVVAGPSEAIAWQVEHNGGWSVEVDTVPGSTEAYLALAGPDAERHGWSATLLPGDRLELVPVLVARAATWEEALAALHRARRARIRHTAPGTGVTYNDYLGTLGGDPSEDALLPLVDAAADAGCDTFVVDAGWFDDRCDLPGGWWTTCGDCVPSPTRFPRGLGVVVDRIRARGMTPGLWLEPEVVGIRSRAARDLPAEAFCTVGGVRVRERGRYFLDLRRPAGRAHADAAVDAAVALGATHVKLDFNTTPGPLPHLLELNRAHLAFLDGIRARHPDLVVENCAAGAQRADFAVLSRCDLQSTSDQEDPLLQPAIAVGALAHLLPEQAGQWASPQADWPPELVAFAEVTGLAGRLYQSGPLPDLPDASRSLVAEAVALAHEIAPLLAHSVPRFPLGLPDGPQPWTAVLLDAGDRALLYAWRRPGAPAGVTLPLPWQPHTVEFAYPRDLAPWTTGLRRAGLEVTATGPALGARVWLLSRTA